VSRMSCSDVIQNLSTVSLIAFRVLSRSSRRLRSHIRDILGPRYFTWTRVRDLFKDPVEFPREVVELRFVPLLRMIAVVRAMFTPVLQASLFDLEQPA
jgi:hypothetical protein